MKNLTVSFFSLHIPDSFCDNEVGFIPWKGERSLNLRFEYTFFINKKILNLTPSISLGYSKELDEPYVFHFSSSYSFTFNNLLQVTPNIGYGKYFEKGFKFFAPFFGILIGNLFFAETKNKVSIFFDTHAAKIFNYKQNYVGWTTTSNLILLLNLKNFSLISSISQWIEFNPQYNIEEITHSIRLKFSLNLTDRIFISLYSDVPITKEGVMQERVGLMFFWNPSGKNEIKTIYNDFQANEMGRWKVWIKKITTKLIPSFYF